MALLAAACGSADSGSAPTPAENDPVERLEARSLADFTLTDQDGSPYTLSDGAGRVRLFYFGYTSCPDICPTTMVDWNETAELLGDDARSVDFIMVTVDPDVDRPAVLKQFLANFNSSFVGLSGSADELKAVWDEFGVTVKRLELPDSATGHSISHSASTWVVDQDGELTMKLRFDADPEDMVRGVRQVLDES